MLITLKNCTTFCYGKHSKILYLYNVSVWFVYKGMITRMESVYNLFTTGKNEIVCFTISKYSLWCSTFIPIHSVIIISTDEAHPNSKSRKDMYFTSRIPI